MPRPTSPEVERPVSEHYASRVTVDLDDHGDLELRAVRAYHYLLDAADGVDVHVSSSGEGIHLVGYFRRSLSFAERIRHRRQAGDDPRRVDMEVQRWHNGLDVDVIFSQKDTAGAGDDLATKERRYADVWDALDAVRANKQDPSERIAALANDGHKGDPALAYQL